MHLGLLIVVFIVGVFGVIPRHTGATVSSRCTSSQPAGDLTIDNHMKLSIGHEAGLVNSLGTVIPFPNISFYSDCPFVKIDMEVSKFELNGCYPQLMLLKEFPGKRYHIASVKIQPDNLRPHTPNMGIATWTGVCLDDYISDN
eukprot:scpid109338/ scgid3416/ 